MGCGVRDGGGMEWCLCGWAEGDKRMRDGVGWNYVSVGGLLWGGESVWVCAHVPFLCTRVYTSIYMTHILTLELHNDGRQIEAHHLIAPQII